MINTHKPLAIIINDAFDQQYPLEMDQIEAEKLLNKELGL